MKLSLALFTCLCTLLSNAQQYGFIQYSIQEGLAQTQVTDIKQDSDGNLWVATLGGVSKFNGVDFTNYNKQNGLFENRINALFIDDSKVIWAAGTGGISWIDGRTISRIKFPPQFNDARVTSLIVLGENVFCGTRKFGIIKFNLSPDNLSILGSEQFLEGTNIRSLCLRNSKIIASSKGGVYSYDPFVNDEPVILKGSEKLNANGVDFKGDTCYVSSLDKGVVYGLLKQRTLHLLDTIRVENNVVRMILVAKNNQIWAAGKTGVALIENDKFENLYDHNNGLENENIRVVFQDSESNIWFGSDGGGLTKFSGNKFVGYTVREGLPSNLIMTIAENEQGHWFGTYGEGVANIENGLTTKFPYHALSNNTIWCSHVSRLGMVYFGTSKGLSVTVEGNVKAVNLSDDLNEARITSLFENDTSLVIGHRNGLTFYNEISKQQFSPAIDVTRIRSIKKWNDGLLLAAHEGLFHYSKDSLIKLSNHPALTQVHCIVSDARNRIWAGNASGLFLVNGNATRQIPIGVASGINFINFLQFENDSVLWIGTNQGIVTINTNKDDFSIPELVHYTPENGIRSYETNLNASYKDKNGNLWFGTTKGAVKLSPNLSESIAKSLRPNLSIDEVQLFLNHTDWSDYDGKSPAIADGAKLSYRQNHLTFKFNGVSLSNPGQVIYQTMLGGFDEKWNPITSEKYLTYTNLSPGDYTFKVRSSVDGKTWTNAEKVNFSINAPFWQKWWFFTLCGLVFFTILYGYYKFRINQEEQKRNTQRILYKSRLMNLEQQSLNASMNRHFIFNALNSIQYYINREDKLSANKYLSSFAKLIRKNLDSSSSKDNLVKLSEEIERLELYITLEHMRFQDKFEYSINVDSKIDLESVRVPAMFLQPFVENSIWHGILPKKEGGKIEVSVNLINEVIIFRIVDNGIGIIKSMEKKHLSSTSHDSKGMKLTSSRIDVLSKITLKDIQISGPSQTSNNKGEVTGTEVEIRYPL